MSTVRAFAFSGSAGCWNISDAAMCLQTGGGARDCSSGISHLGILSIQPKSPSLDGVGGNLRLVSFSLRKVLLGLRDAVPIGKPVSLMCVIGLAIQTTMAVTSDKSGGVTCCYPGSAFAVLPCDRERRVCISPVGNRMVFGSDCSRYNTKRLHQC